MYNPNRKNRPRTCFNSRPVFTETAQGISPESRATAEERKRQMIKVTRKNLGSQNNNPTDEPNI